MSVRGPVIDTAPGVFRAPSTMVGVRATATSWRGRLGIGGVLLAGLLVAAAAPHTPSLLPETIRPAPVSLQGVFGPVGLDLHVGGAIAALVLMFVSYALVTSVASEISPRVILGAIVVLNLLVWLAPPLVSTDAFSYQAYARMGAQYGVNPYLNGPYAIRLDGVFPYVGAKWSYIPSAYGPVFTAFSYLLAPLGVAASVVAYKSIAVFCSLALVAIVWRCAQVRGSDPVRAAALVGLNPLLVVYGVGGGHNDLLMLVLLAGGVYAILAGRARSGGALAVLAIGVKLTAGIVLPFALAAGGRERRRRDLVVGLVASCTAIATLSVTMFGTGALHLLATVGQSQSQSRGDWNSIPAVIEDRLGLPTLGHVVGAMLAAGFLVLCARLLYRVWQGRMDWIDGAGWATLAMLVASSSLLPWYVCWLLPFAALGRDPRLTRTALTLTGVVLGIQMLGYIPHG